MTRERCELRAAGREAPAGRITGPLLCSSNSFALCAHCCSCKGAGVTQPLLLLYLPSYTWAFGAEKEGFPQQNVIPVKAVPYQDPSHRGPSVPGAAAASLPLGWAPGLCMASYRFPTPRAEGAEEGPAAPRGLQLPSALKRRGRARPPLFWARALAWCGTGTLQLPSVGHRGGGGGVRAQDGLYR